MWSPFSSLSSGYSTDGDIYMEDVDSSTDKSVALSSSDHVDCDTSQSSKDISVISSVR